eukprot:tig00001302_g8089.t1
MPRTSSSRLSPGRVRRPGGGVNEDLEYMTEEELANFIEANEDLQLTDQEIEYLFLRRRRLSIERANKDGRVVSPDKAMGAAPVSPSTAQRSAPYKVMVLGNEDLSGKISLLQLFALESQRGGRPAARGGVTPEPSAVDFLPLEIQRHQIMLGPSAGGPEDETLASVSREDSAMLELWAPLCTKEYKSLRPQYYPATDVFLIVFSISDPGALSDIRTFWDREVKDFLQSCSHKEIPVILVGNHAERRAEAARHELVYSQEAVQLARELGYFKYIEIQSYNSIHIYEVFRQAALSVRLARTRNQHKMRNADYVKEFDREDGILRKFLQLQPPVGHFYYDTRRFELQKYPGVVYLMTFDGSDPDHSSQRYSEPVQLKRPYPSVIKVVSLTRCKYRSPVTSFTVPEESEPPSGHYDILAGTLILDKRTGPNGQPCSFYYTLDGSRPTVQTGTLYDGVGISVEPLLAQAKIGISSLTGMPKSGTDGAGSPGMNGVDPASVPSINVVAFEYGKFISKTVHFQLPPALPPPLVRYKIREHTFVIEDAAAFPHVDFRYTLDGSKPSCTSRLYTGPVSINPANMKCLKVEAFPKTVLPSVVVELQVHSAPDAAESEADHEEQRPASRSRARSPARSPSPHRAGPAVPRPASAGSTNRPRSVPSSRPVAEQGSFRSGTAGAGRRSGGGGGGSSGAAAVDGASGAASSRGGLYPSGSFQAPSDPTYGASGASQGYPSSQPTRSNRVVNPKPFNPFPPPAIPVRSKRGIKSALTPEQERILTARLANSNTGQAFLAATRGPGSKGGSPPPAMGAPPVGQSLDAGLERYIQEAVRGDGYLSGAGTPHYPPQHAYGYSPVPFADLSGAVPSARR